MSVQDQAIGYVSGDGNSQAMRFPTLSAMIRNPTQTPRYLRFLAESALRPIEVPDAPHLELPAIEALDRRINSGTVLLEYGAGGSSLHFARKGAAVLSVDTSRRWARAVNGRLAAEELTTSHVAHVDIGPTLKWGKPLDGTPTDENKRRWWRYLSTNWSEADYRNQSPCTVLIDGRFRLACAAYSVREMLRRRLDATIFFDDYASRVQYHDIERLVDIVQMHGRMAEMKVKAGVSTELATQVVEAYLTDYR